MPDRRQLTNRQDLPSAVCVKPGLQVQPRPRTVAFSGATMRAHCPFPFEQYPALQLQLLPGTNPFFGALMTSQHPDAASANPSRKRHPLFVMTALPGRGPVCSA